MLTAADDSDRAIPGARYGFGDLRTAQALGDLASLESRDRPVLRLHLAAGAAPGLEALARAVERALVAPMAGA